MKDRMKTAWFEKARRNGRLVGRQALIVLTALLAATILVIVFGFEWDSVLQGIRGAVVNDVNGTLRWFTPLLLTGLSCALAFRGGIWNMGVDGQLYMGAIAATAVAIRCAALSPGPLLALVFLAGMAAGALWAGIAGLLRVYCGAKEVVTTILLNYIAFHFTDYMVLGPLKGSGGYAVAESSDMIGEQIWLTKLIQGSTVTTGLIIAFVSVVVVYVLTTNTPFGYENRMLGTNRAFANYGGINVRRTFMATILISGAIAGLAGVIEILGVHHRFPIRFSNNLGFDGIVVSILANDSAIGVPLSAFFFAVLRNGSYNIERLSDVPKSLVLVVQAMVILMVGARFAMPELKRKDIIKKIRRGLHFGEPAGGSNERLV